MKKPITGIASILIYTLVASINLAQAQEQSKGANVDIRSERGHSQFQFTSLLAQARLRRRAGFSLMPASSNSAAPPFASASIISAANLQVFGNGTPGRLTKWVGFTSNNSLIGDSNIYEDKVGKVGIGTTAPTSLLTVQGMIETTLGGFKFPDSTVQTTAFDSNQVVRSLNGLTGNVTLAQGDNITITPSGNTLTIAAANALIAVAHDATLQGSGTLASPLGVAVPLNLSGLSAGPVFSVFNSVTLTGVRIGGFFSGVDAFGGDAVNSGGGNGVSGFGGDGRFGGIGVIALGGNSTSGPGAAGMESQGGNASGVGQRGGDGITAASGLGRFGATDGRAGFFFGDVEILGNLTKTTGTFKIDHPLDPENKYLYHSFVESPDMMNIYNGNITTDENGEAVVEMPDYFDALNKDFRYQLTVIGTFAQAIVASEMKDNRFVIKTNAATVKVSWMVTGVRHDAYADKHRIKVEEVKAESERGYYLHPEVFNQPEEKSIEWARHSEMMQRLKQHRLEAQEKIRKQ